MIDFTGEFRFPSLEKTLLAIRKLFFRCRYPRVFMYPYVLTLNTIRHCSVLRKM